MENLYLYNNGKRRKAEEGICIQCCSKYLRRKGNPQKVKFCSHKCFYENQKKEGRLELTCFNCKISFVRKKSNIKNSKHGFYFCSRECKEQSQSLSGNCKEIRPSHYGTVKKENIDYRKLCQEEIEKGCGCGEKNKYLMFVHHIDGNRNNNEKCNLEVVCGNCHIKRHLKKINNEWFYSCKSLTPRNEIPL